MTAIRLFKGKHIRALLCMFVFTMLYNGYGASADAEGIRLISRDDLGLELEVNVSGFELRDIETREGTFQQVVTDFGVWSSEPGKPQLPTSGVMIQVPAEGFLRVRLTESVIDHVPGCRIYPVPDLSLDENGERRYTFYRDETVYGSTAYYPGSYAEIGDRAVMRGTDTARVIIRPFHWNPATGELLCYRKMRLRVEFENSLSEFPKRGKPDSEGMFHDIKQNVIINRFDDDAVSSEDSFSVRKMNMPNDVTALKIEITDAGVYRLTHADLVGAGVNASAVEPTSFQMYYLDEEAAVRVVTAQAGVFADGDYIEWHADSIDDRYTGTNVYWLFWGLGTGKRLTTRDGTPLGSVDVVTDFNETLHFEENPETWNETPKAPEADFFFWNNIVTTVSYTMTKTIQVPAPITDQTDVTLRTRLQGVMNVSGGDHHTLLKLNGETVSDETWASRDSNTQQVTDIIQEGSVSQPITSGFLAEGSNTYNLVLPFDTTLTVDRIYLDWIELDYRRRLEAVDDALYFNLDGSGPVEIQVNDFSSSDIRVLDVTDPVNTVEIENAVIEDTGGVYRVRFEDDITGGRSYFAYTTGLEKQPSALVLWEPTLLSDSGNGADYIAIAPKEFMDALEPLLDYHRSNGLRVMAVPIEDIYREFNHGIFHPDAIRDFLSHAYFNWTSPAPSYVLLAGDACSDFRGYHAYTTRVNKVPPHLFQTLEIGLTPNDDWFVCVDGEDVLPDMMIGRMVGADAQTIQDTVDKTLAYYTAQTEYVNTILFTADDDDENYDYESDDLAESLPERYGSDKVYLRYYDTGADCAAAIIASVDAGRLIVNYIGHGNVYIWGAKLVEGAYMFENDRVAEMNNKDKYPVVFSWNCMSGFFCHFFRHCLGGELVLHAEKGAVGAYAPGGAAYLWSETMLARNTFANIFEDGIITMGPVIFETEIESYAQNIDPDVLVMFNWFGDPALKLNIPKGDYDGNGRVDMADYVLVQQTVSGGMPTNMFDNSVDINANGRIDEDDGLGILQDLDDLR